MKNLGQEIKDATIVEKILRYLSSKFESKVSSIVKKQDIQSVTFVQLHGILSAFEVAFKASTKGK